MNNIKSTVTEVRVSASGEVEKDGAILQTGGIHEPDFFQMFFTNIENSLLLKNNKNILIDILKKEFSIQKKIL